jgi:L-threonylcarbamoyladenylate synthase
MNTVTLSIPKNTPRALLPKLLAPAVELLRQDKVVAIPTETVYGLAANAMSAMAVDAIYTAKGRPRDNPLIVHCSSMDMVAKFFLTRGEDGVASFPPVYRQIVQKYWPGPLTIILPVQQGVLPDQVTCGLSTVAVRVPDDVITRTLIEACGFPLAAPSANTSTRPSPTTAAHVLEDLNGKIPMVIDGGELGDGMCQVGIESTVLDGLGENKVILRPGAVTMEELKQMAGWEDVQMWHKTAVKEDGWKPVAPGMKYQHYAPRTPVTLVLPSTKPIHRDDVVPLLPRDKKVALLGVHMPPSSDTDLTTISLGSTVADMAHLLFAKLREVDTTVDEIWVIGVAEEGIGSAVMNRLRKAAAHTITL